MKNRREELQKGVRLHVEYWFFSDYPEFKEGDFVWTHGSKNIAQTVHHQDGTEVYTEFEHFHVLNIEYFVLQPDQQTNEQNLIALAHQINNTPKVDFEMLKNMLRPGGITSVLTSIYCNPTQEELSNLALFFEMIGKSSSFAHLVHKKLSK